MKMRALGQTGLMVSPLCFGGNVFGWTADEATSFQLLDSCVDKGINFIDTADVYSAWAKGHKGGESEEVIGKWLKRSGKRDKIVLATKVGYPMGPGHSSPDKKGLSKKYIMQAVEDSLKRLQTDVIDLYQSHGDDPLTPFHETFEAYQALIQQGKVRAIGASNYSGERLNEALIAARKAGLPLYQTMQPLYNLYDRENFEHDLEEVCVANGLAVVTYFSLAAGFLTGKYRSEKDLGQSERGERTVKKYLDERGLKILKALDSVAAKHNTTPAQVSIAWLLSRPAVTCPIASATKLKQLDELISAVNLNLDAVSLEYLDQVSKVGPKPKTLLPNIH